MTIIWIMIAVLLLAVVALMFICIGVVQQQHAITETLNIEVTENIKLVRRLAEENREAIRSYKDAYDYNAYAANNNLNADVNAVARRGTRREQLG